MQKSRVRPDPVSCESCRSKKLKCNRTQPCSNCSARGITCKFLVPPQKTQSRVLSNESLLPRLERLEAVVNNLQQQSRTVNYDMSVPSAISHPRHYSRLVGSAINSFEDEDRFLENIGTRDDTLLCDMSNPLTYELKSIAQILDLPAGHHLEDVSHHKVELPPFRVASLLLQTYEVMLVSLCPIVHMPTIRSLLKATYLRLNNTKSVPSSNIALLMSLFALGAFFSDPYPTSEVVTTEADAVTLSKAFSRSALDALDHSQRSGSGTLEDVQAYILMSLAISHIDGFSTRSRMLFSSAVSMARDLRLHRLDEGSPYIEPITGIRSLIDKEIKRRVFWYIASEDWLQSTISGPQEGTYWIQYSQIKVNLPRDCTEDELALSETNENISSDAPTHMMVFLERIRLGHICREITDTVPLDTNALLQMPYEHIIALDQKLGNFLSTMPRFLQHDCHDKDILESIYTQLPSWSYCITKSAFSRRWKLNQRFLLRQNVDPRYAYSRRACMESARAVIKGYTHLVSHHSASALLTRTGMAVHFTHLALSILVMDLCFNRVESEEAQIKGDIEAAFRIFESATIVSPLLTKSLASLKAVLRRNRINFESKSERDIEGNLEDNDHTTRSAPKATESVPLSYQGQFNEQDAVIETIFDNFLDNALQSNGEIGLDGWDDLFSNFDNRPI